MDGATSRINGERWRNIMNLDEIKTSWREDAKLDITQLDEEAAKDASLHSKYYDLYADERKILKQLQLRNNIARKEKWEFFTQGASKEHIDKGWQLPAKGAIMKNEVQMYLDADEDLVKMVYQLECQAIKLDFLKSIIDTIHKRGFQIKNANDFIRWSNGG